MKNIFKLQHKTEIVISSFKYLNTSTFELKITKIKNCAYIFFRYVGYNVK